MCGGSTDAMQGTVLLGSSRPRGNTWWVAQRAFPPAVAEHVDLATSGIGPYSYERANDGDGFQPLVQRVAQRPLLVLATPLYWYTMSAQAKTFMDRLSDLLDTELGRTLQRTRLAVVCTGSDPAPPPSFDEPFRLTCEYLGLRFCGSHYAQFDGDAPVSPSAAAEAADFGRALLQA